MTTLTFVSLEEGPLSEEDDRELQLSNLTSRYAFKTNAV